ncbi:MAG: hypothetical protein LBH93_09005, partial [Chitinispirillales bacterium]|nr:hypothetical protein [Chitinispirillales bacterium]
MIRLFNRRIAKIRLALAAASVMAAASHVWAQGLPGEYLITDRWRHVYSMYSGVTNPAYVNEENYMALRFLFANTLEEFNTHEAGFNMPLGLYDAAGVSWLMHGVNPFDETDDGGATTGKKIRDQGHFIALSYARNVWAGLTVGGNLNIILQNISDFTGGAGSETENATRFGFGVDVGLTWKVIRHQLLGNHILGLSTNNFVNMIMDTDEKYAAALRFSLLSDFWERRIYYGADFVLKDFLAGEGDFKPGNVKDMPWDFTQKIGANILRIFKLYVLMGFDPSGIGHYGFAFGANMPGFFNGRDIEGMMQFVSIANGSGGEASHITFYARTEL